MTYDQPTHPPTNEGDEREDDLTPEEAANKRHDDDHAYLHTRVLALNARIETLQFSIGRLEQALAAINRRLDIQATLIGQLTREVQR